MILDYSYELGIIRSHFDQDISHMNSIYIILPTS